MEDFLSVIQGSYDSPLADLVRLKYIYGHSIGESERWEKIGDKVFRNRKVLPPAFLAGGYEILAGDDNYVFQKIRGGLVDPSSTVLLQAKPRELFPSQPGPAGTAKITRFGNNRIDLECQADRPGLLFLAEEYFPGWVAEVDGKTAPVLQANGIFRAVPIASTGFHRVSMVFCSWPLYIGLVISTAAWLMLIVLGWKKRDWSWKINGQERLLLLIRAVFGLSTGVVQKATKRQ